MALTTTLNEELVSVLRGYFNTPTLTPPSITPMIGRLSMVGSVMLRRIVVESEFIRLKRERDIPYGGTARKRTSDRGSLRVRGTEHPKPENLPPPESMRVISDQRSMKMKSGRACLPAGTRLVLNTGSENWQYLYPIHPNHCPT